MAKQETLNLTGVIVEALPNVMFRVKLDNVEKTTICMASGKIRQNRIRLVLGDKVEVEFSPYDFDKGRITRRN